MRKIIRHASLFSGIGAPELAALWLGWQNVFHCEINEFCNTILNYWFPNSINYENIKTTDFSRWQGQIDILTGGFPCQPFSSAGRRLGTDDDRYLWPEMLRVIRQIQPTFVIGENVAGIISMVQPGEEVKVGSTTSLFEENDDIYQKKQEFVVETVCSDLECEGYSVQPFVIPACAVGAPHQRDRVWFVARRNVPTSPTDTMYEGILRRPGVNESEGKAQRLQERNEIQQPTEPSSLLRHAPDTFNTGAEGMRERQAENSFSRAASHTISGGDTTQQAYQGSEEERRKDDGQMDFFNFHGILPTPCAQDFKKRGVNSKQKGLPEMFRKWDWLLTPGASDGMRIMMTMDNLKRHRKKNAAQSNLSEQIAHKNGGGTSQLSPLFVEEMMGYPLIYLVLPFLLQDGDRNR